MLGTALEDGRLGPSADLPRSGTEPHVAVLEAKSGVNKADTAENASGKVVTLATSRSLLCTNLAALCYHRSLWFGLD